MARRCVFFLEEVLLGRSLTMQPTSGTGQFKLGANYAPCFTPQKKAQVQGYQQNLWILKNELGSTVTEAGQMNVFVAHKDEAGGQSSLGRASGRLLIRS
jgi:branched-subunit amino acid aminotransferase/4-amino-4-deoxychorismate lyase